MPLVVGVEGQVPQGLMRPELREIRDFLLSKISINLQVETAVVAELGALIQ
jgi:hypothetical protein